MDKQNVICPYHGILYSLKKEETALVYSSSYKESLKRNGNIFPKAEKIVNAVLNLFQRFDKY